MTFRIYRLYSKFFKRTLKITGFLSLANEQCESQCEWKVVNEEAHYSKILTWWVPGTGNGRRNCVEKKSLWGSTVCSKFWLQSGNFSLACNTLAAGFCNWEFRVSLKDLTLLN